MDKEREKQIYITDIENILNNANDEAITKSEEMYDEAYQRGYDEGYDEGNQEGFDAGKKEGREEAEKEFYKEEKVKFT